MLLTKGEFILAVDGHGPQNSTVLGFAIVFKHTWIILVSWIHYEAFWEATDSDCNSYKYICYSYHFNCAPLMSLD